MDTTETGKKTLTRLTINNFLPLFWGIVMYANEFETKEKQKLTATYIPSSIQRGCFL